jgi:four helix bundle protein
MSRENRFRLSAAVPENDEIRMTNGEGITRSELAHDASDKLFWNSEVPSVVREEASDKGVVYDVEERTARFGEAVIDFVKTIPQDAVTSRIISQLVGAVTSVGTNYVEADDAVSKREFLKSIGTCRKEAGKAKHFLRMIVRVLPELKPRARILWTEAKELDLIFSKIWRTGKMNDEAEVRGDRGTTEYKFVRHSTFGIISSFVIRHSSFG